MDRLHKHPAPSNSSAASRSQAAEMQRRTRQERNFDKTEADLPNLSPHTSWSLKNPITAKLSAQSKLGDLLSYLGPHNPLPVQITAKDTVWLLDNVAFQAPDGKWKAEFVAAAFAQHPSCTVVDAVKTIADKCDLAEDDNAAWDTIERRLMPFLQDILPGRQIKAQHGSSTQLTLGPGGRNGISSDLREVPAAPAGMVVPATAQVPTGADGLLGMKTFFSAPDGWAVISDVDDTIKITQTSDPIGILRTTFIDEPKVVDGMPEFYKWLQGQLTSASPFFYLSASPYNLYPFLRDFRDKYYPHGQLILRDASWMSIPGLLSNLTVGTEEYKVDRMQKIHSWLPKKKLILIGDSTQSDPEAFGDIYRAFPGWVKVILIRKVDDIAAIGIESKNEPQRFEKAFEKIPKDVWHVFEDPKECYKVVESALA